VTDTFGDFDNDDAVDTAPPDPAQVARKLQRIRREYGQEVFEWDDLDDGGRAVRVAVVTLLLAWLRRQGPR
jgi:hypothetical protein